MAMIITISAVTLFSFAFALLLECALLKWLFHFLSGVGETADKLPAAQPVLAIHSSRGASARNFLIW